MTTTKHHSCSCSASRGRVLDDEDIDRIIKGEPSSFIPMILTILFLVVAALLKFG